MVDDPDERLLPRVKRVVSGWQQFEWPDRGRYLRDASGTRYAILTRDQDGQMYVFAAKKSLKGDRSASFMPRLVDQAIDTDSILVLLVGKDPSMGTAWAFNPVRVEQKGTEGTVNSKMDFNVEVLDVEAPVHGVNLGDLLAGTADLPAPDSTWDQFGSKSGANEA